MHELVTKWKLEQIQLHKKSNNTLTLNCNTPFISHKNQFFLILSHNVRHQSFITKVSCNSRNEPDKIIAKRNTQSSNDLVSFLELMMIVDEAKNPILINSFVTMFLMSTSNFIRSLKSLQPVIKSRFEYFLWNLFKQFQYIITQKRQHWLISSYDFKNVCNIRARTKKKELPWVSASSLEVLITLKCFFLLVWIPNAWKKTSYYPKQV